MKGLWPVKVGGVNSQLYPSRLISFMLP